MHCFVSVIDAPKEALTTTQDKLLTIESTVASSNFEEEWKDNLAGPQFGSGNFFEAKGSDPLGTEYKHFNDDSKNSNLMASNKAAVHLVSYVNILILLANCKLIQLL